MALNRVREHGTRLALPVPDGTVSGDALVLGGLPCVAVTDADEWTEGEASVQTDGTWRFPVHAAGGAIEPGAIVYRDAGDGSLSDSNADVRFGYALQHIDNGATVEIEVKVGY